MKIVLYQVDAFTDSLFGGNPAAVCPLREWLTDELLQKIAEENNLSETAFIVPKGGGYTIRWFTPLSEVNLCGHATLASAYVIFHFLDHEGREIIFQSKSGELRVMKENDVLTLNFPAYKVIPVAPDSSMESCFSVEPVSILTGKEDLLFIYENEIQIQNLEPDFVRIKKLKYRGVIVSAKGDAVDFVSRFFAPAFGVDEDPVTGSAHSLLTPYWGKILNKRVLSAKQLSKRGGNLTCSLEDDRVFISGKAVLYLKGEIELPD